MIRYSIQKPTFRVGHAVRVACVILCALLLCPTGQPFTARADPTQNLGDMVFAAGTVATDSHAREWVYLNWMATDPTILLGVQYDIHAKDGASGSGSPYVFKGSAMLQADPNSITVLANRSVHLGQDLSRLEDVIDQLFAEAIPDAGLSLGEKIAAVINGSVEDTEMYHNLVFLSQVHPALALAIGRGFSCRIAGTGLTTFEIRDHNTGEVVGRLTVEGGNPLVLPAPGDIQQSFDETPKGHLNIRLRWTTPDALRRVSTMQVGYNLFRIEKEFAEHPSRQFETPPPATAVLLNLAETVPEVKQVSKTPIILAGEDNASSNACFFVDDNDGLSDGGIPFMDGEMFYYFVTALDLLGRDGDVSNGFLAKACDRVPPRVPKDIRTRALYDYVGSNTIQSVEITWDQDQDLAETAAYHVYRHTSISNMQANAGDPQANRIAGPILPIPGAERLSYTNTLTLSDQDRTFWYTVRGIDDASCGPNLSLNSAPVHGGIHDWEGPEDSFGSWINIFVGTITAHYQNSGAAAPGDTYTVELSCNRGGSAVTWVEFAYQQGENTNSATATSCGRFHFGGDHAAVHSIELPEESTFTFFCRVGDIMKTSGYASFSREFNGEAGWIEFLGDVNYGYEPASAGGTHDFHGLVSQFPELITYVPTGAGEYRFYRTVDNGPRTLLAQGATSNAAQIIKKDQKAGIVNGGTICYYVQFLDFNGNPGPIKLIECIEVKRTIALPTPELARIEPTGSESSPGMQVKWFCAPQGVERFEVAVHMDQAGYPANFSPDLRNIENNGTTNFIEAVLGGNTNKLGFVTYRTGRVGANFGVPDAAKFLIGAGSNPNVEYILMVRALGGGAAGPWSRAQRFVWKVVPDQGPLVPWPARGLPPVRQAALFHSNLSASLLLPGHQGVDIARVGIRIGEIPHADLDAIMADGTIRLSVTNDPMKYLYEDMERPGETVMSCVLYRYQVQSPLFPEVSGDVAQVSVMMEALAWGRPLVNTYIFDPFVAVARTHEQHPWELYLLDTHPVVRGAAYRYLLLRFGEDGEPDRIIKVDVLNIPEE